MSADAPRHHTLDALRGIAVMGIVLMNVGDFAAPQQAYLQPLLAGRTPADIAVWVGEFMLADGKFRNLFSLLFGASLLLIAERAEAAGGSAAATHYRRMGWLLPLGLAHLYLLWWGDILHHYAILGSLAFLVRRHPPEALIVMGLIILVFDAALLGSNVAGFWSLHAAAAAPDAPPAAVVAWQKAANTIAADPAALRHQMEVYRSPYAAILHDRLVRQAWLPLDELLAAGPETFALMLFGMAALRSGFLTGGWTRAAYRRVAIGGYAIGLPVMAALAWWCVAARFDPLVSLTAIVALALPVRALIMAAHAALLILWLTRRPGPVAARIAAVGRMALTNYVATSVLLGLVFYGYGFGLYGRIGRAAQLLPVGGIWALMLLWSGPWLDRFAYGPLEWVWRSLARLRLQPFRANRRLAIAKRSH